MPEPTLPSSDAELRALAERALSSHYDVERELGRGGMGIVYQALDRRLKRTVAIKVLPPELGFRAEIRSRFLREAETAAQLNHPNIVPIYSVDEREGLVFFVMACVAGVTLARLLASSAHDGTPLPSTDARRTLTEVAEALAYAHARGVIHRDIKPDNILLDAESGRAMVTDFGIARAVQESGDTRLTATGIAIGTPAFMSPEQAVGERELDGRSDLYSLGVVGYLMLAGTLPFTAASTPSMLLKHVSERPVPVAERRTGVPHDLAIIVMRLLEKDPEHRFASAAALAQALRGDGRALAPAALDRSAAPAGRAVPAGRAGPERDGPPARTNEPAASGGAAVSTYAPGRAAARGVTSDAQHDLALRWEAEPVRRFRRQLGYFVAVNSVIVAGSIVGSGDYTSVTLLWSIVLAYRYAKLWERGYDWRDVLHQPRERRLADLATEWADDARRLVRRITRGRHGELHSSGASTPAPAPVRRPVPVAALPKADASLGRHADAIARARADEAEIVRLVRALPRRDRKIARDVPGAAAMLLARMESLALDLAVLERNDEEAALAGVDAEIARLEADANPLDGGSDERVRQLASLKRQRRAILAGGERRRLAEGRLASCALALESVRLDVLRLRAGRVAEDAGLITQLTERARAVADDVDRALGGAQSAERSSAPDTFLPPASHAP